MTNIDFRDLGPKLLKKRKSVLTAGLVAGDSTNPYSIRIVFNDDADFRDEKRVSKFLKKHNITLNTSTSIPSEFDTKDSLFLRISNSYPEGSKDVRNKVTPDPVQSGFSIGNVPWFTDGTATGILEIQIDGGSPKNYLLSIHHVLLGEDGKPGNDVSAPSVRYLLGKDYSQFIVGKTTSHFQTPFGTEWALALLNNSNIDPEIKGLNPPIKPLYNSNQAKPDIGDYVVKSGYGSKVTFGQIVAIHVFAKVEDGSYLEGFEIAPVEPIKTGSDITNFDPSESPFAANSDSGALILKMEKDTTTNIYSAQESPIGILALMTGQDDSDVELGYAIYFDEVIKSIENHFQGHTINKLNFIQ